MKRFVAIILMCLLAANVGGVSITHHICGTKSQYFSFTGKRKVSHCCCKGEAKDRGCCKTIFVKVKVDNSKSLAKQIVLHPYAVITALLPEPITIAMRPKRIASVSRDVPRTPPPPLLLPVRKHVLHGVFLI